MTTASTSTQGRDHSGNSAASGFQGKLEQAKGRISEVESAIQSRAEEAVATTENYVGSHPWKSLAVAGSIGIVLGLLIGRR